MADETNQRRDAPGRSARSEATPPPSAGQRRPGGGRGRGGRGRGGRGGGRGGNRGGRGGNRGGRDDRGVAAAAATTMAAKS